MKSLREILVWPAGLAVTTIAGLVIALISNEKGDMVGAACLGVVVLTGLYPLISWVVRKIR